MQRGVVLVVEVVVVLEVVEDVALEGCNSDNLEVVDYQYAVVTVEEGINVADLDWNLDEKSFWN